MELDASICSSMQWCAVPVRLPFPLLLPCLALPCLSYPLLTFSYSLHLSLPLQLLSLHSLLLLISLPLSLLRLLGVAPGAPLRGPDAILPDGSVCASIICWLQRAPTGSASPSSLACEGGFTQLLEQAKLVRGSWCILTRSNLRSHPTRNKPTNEQTNESRHLQSTLALLIALSSSALSLVTHQLHAPFILHRSTHPPQSANTNVRTDWLGQPQAAQANPSVLKEGIMSVSALSFDEPNLSN